VIATSNGGGEGTIYAYSAYGEPAYDNWSGSRFRYTGQIMLPEAKLYHYKARVYDPALGRFLQTDPVGYSDDLNLYAYVGNDPLDRADPTGTYSCGSSLSGEQCQNFITTQDQAKAQISSTIAALKTIQSKLASGAKLSAAEQAVTKGISGLIGKGAGTDSKVLGALVSTGEKMLGVLNGSMPAEAGPGSTHATAEPGQVTLHPAYFASDSKMQAETVAHESAHHVGANDTPVGMGMGQPALQPFGRANLERMAEFKNNPSYMLQKADAIALSMGFERTDGY